MLIQKEVKFDKGQAVYPIYEDAANNDFYCTDTAWYMLIDTEYKDGKRIPKPYTVENIRLQFKGKDIVVFYLVDGIWFEEGLVFETYEKAKAEVKARNERKF